MQKKILQKVNKIITKIEKNSQRKIENKELIKKYLVESFEIDKKITLYNWECPPRSMGKDKDNKLFVNYDIDLKKIFEGKKMDEFTELPRVVEMKNQEIKILNFLKDLDINFRFVKLIADTNAYFLTPNSLDVLGSKKIEKKFQEFKNLIINQTKNYPTKVETYLFSELIGKYSKFYKDSFNSIYKDSNKYINKKLLDEQIKRTKKHVGLKDSNLVKDFSIRTIASYGAEGIVFDILSKTKNFSNCVWSNIEEIDQRTIDISNILRKKQKISKLPMFFLDIS